MTVTRHFVLVVLALAFAVYLLFGGPGLVVLAVGAYFWHLAPYRRGVHSEVTEAHHTVFMVQEDADQTLPGPHRPARYFLQLLFCVGLLILGLIRLDNPGLVGTALFG